MLTSRSPAPEVRIQNATSTPLDNAVAAAKTCYSSRGIVTSNQVRERKDIRDRIARSIYKAGHHTTFQHTYFQFAISGVSRHFIWSFLHSHPFYNSEQVSQRYVKVDPTSIYVPPLEGRALSIYEETVAYQVKGYEDLIELLTPVVGAEYLKRFPGRAGREGEPRSKKYRRDIRKRAQEVARYCLPVATLAYLVHTVNCVTLLRYWRLVRSFDVPHEQREVVGRMIESLLRFDPEFEQIMESPLESASHPEQAMMDRIHTQRSEESIRSFHREFDAELGGRTSRLVDHKAKGERMLADSVREVLGLRRFELDDETAIRIVLDPSRNKLLASSLNLSTHSKLMRTLVHPAYTFKKKLSHTADSQDQRHRMTPGSRPILAAHLTDEPDFVRPILVEIDERVRKRYDQIMQRSWDGIRKLRRLGVEEEFVTYLLPNSTSIRFTESADLLSLRHKLAMRLCYNAQEEIWRASVEEAMQIREVDPLIGPHLLPPCTLRHLAGSRPICPEGDRYCGIPVWRLQLDRFVRTI